MPLGKYMEYEQDQPRFRDPGDLVLFVKALPMARLAQRVRSTPLPEVVAAMGAGGGREMDSRRARVAAGRACSLFCRLFGGLDSCLTRSLVAGAMLSAAHEVLLHVGFRPGSREVPLDGHAWLTVDGERLDLERPDEDVRPYTEVLDIPFSARARSR